MVWLVQPVIQIPDMSWKNPSFCSDFRYESNGIFVLFFFLQANFDFLTSHFWRNFFKYHSKGIVVLSSNLKRYFTCDHSSWSYEGLKIAILAILTNLGQLTRDIFRAKRVSEI